MIRILGVVLAFIASTAFAQSFTWHLPNYGDTPNASPLQPQSLAFDSNNNAFVLQMFYNIATPSARVEKFARADGTLQWSADFTATEAQYFPYFTAPAAIAASGNDVYLVVTDKNAFEQGSVRRVSGSDGSVVWSAGETVAADLYYEAIADASGDAVVAGAIATAGGAMVAHAARFGGSDGTLLWHFDDDVDSCGTQATIHADAVAVDANGDVVLLEQATAGSVPAYVFCVVKLQGDTGAKLWSKQFIAADGINISAQPPAYLRLDASGNAVVSAYYSDQGGGSAVIARFDGATGNLSWKHDWLSSSSRVAGALALDAAGNAVLSIDTTQVYAAANGAPRWASPLSTTGAVAVASDGTILIAHGDTTTIENAQMNFFGLDPATGTTRWQSAQTLPTFGYWNTGNQLAADGAGSFLAAQQGYGQTTLMRAQAANGTTDWVKRDYVLAPGYAAIEPAFGGTDRLMVKSPDNAVIAAAVTSVSSFGYPAPGRWIVVKRSTIDGRTLWMAQGDPARLDCVPRSTLVDAHGDVVVGVTCSYDAIVVKLNGSDGTVRWSSPAPSACVEAFSQSVSSDAAGAVYSTQTCFGTSSSLQVTAKYNAATGALVWSQSTADENIDTSYACFVRADGANGVIVADTTFSDVIVRKLRADTGAIVWTQELTDMFRLSATTLFSNNDALVAGENSVVARLNTSTGAVKWSTKNSDLDMAAAAIDAAGNVYTAGDYVTKFDGNSGQQRWSKQPPAQLRDVAIATDGSVVGVGYGYGNGIGPFVATLESTTGLTRWSMQDTMGTEAEGVIAAPDGGLIVSEASNTGWILTRISGAFAQDIFAAGFEP